MRFATTVLGCLLLTTPLAIDCQEPVRGAFAVLHAPVNASLGQARQDGLNLVILQYTHAAGEAPGIEEARRFMDAAEADSMPYMIGLFYHGSWDQKPRDSIDAYVQSSLALIDSFPHQNRPHFRGWYMALEVGNASADYQMIADAFAPFSAVVDAPVALSLYFNPHRNWLKASDFAAAIVPVISHFDIVLMQDGVGERRVTDAELRPYYDEVKKAVTNSGGRFWAVVEGFRCTHPDRRRRLCPEDDPRPPARRRRICRQVAALRPVTQDVVAYNLGEVLEPTGPDPEKYRAYREYIKAVTAQPCP